MTAPVIESTRLSLSALGLDVLDSYYDAVVRNFDSMTQFLYWPMSMPSKRDCKKQILEELRPDRNESLTLAIHLKESKEFIGCFHIRSVNVDIDSRILPDPQLPNTKEFGFWIDKKHQGNGYGTEAIKLAETYTFDVFKPDAIAVVANCENKPSMHVAKKAGYKFVKTYRYVDREDWGEQEFFVFAKFAANV